MLRATADVEDSFSGLVKREDEARILVDGEQSLSKARTASEVAYKAGAVSLIEVLDADQRLLAQSGRPFELRVFTQDYPSEVHAIPIGANAVHINRGEKCGAGFGRAPFFSKETSA